jgi:hypothetical protein
LNDCLVLRVYLHGQIKKAWKTGKAALAAFPLLITTPLPQERTGFPINTKTKSSSLMSIVRFPPWDRRRFCKITAFLERKYRF